MLLTLYTLIYNGPVAVLKLIPSPTRLVKPGRTRIAAHGKQLSPIDVQEIDDIPFDFTDAIGPGETIVTAVINVAVSDGYVDLNPQSMVVGVPQIGRIAGGVFLVDATGPVVLQRIHGGKAGTLYDIRGVAVLSSGRIVIAAARLPVVSL